MFVEAAVILEYCPLEDDIPLSASQTGEIGLVCGDQQSVSGRQGGLEEAWAGVLARLLRSRLLRSPAWVNIRLGSMRQSPIGTMRF